MKPGMKKISENFFVTSVFAFWIAIWCFLNFRILPPVDSIAFPLANENYLPYRDYYFPVTPGTYFLSKIASFFSIIEITFAYRLLGLLFVPLLLWSAYSIARRFLSKINSAILSGFASSVFFSLGLEMFGGWNLIPLSLYIVGLALLVRHSPLSSSTREGAKFSNSNLTVFLSGIAFSVAGVFKQTFLIQLLAQIVLFVVFMAAATGGIKELKSIPKAKLLAFSLGLILPFLLVYFWLAINDIYGIFIQNMLSFGGKNPSLFDLVGSTFVSVITGMNNFLAIAFILFLALLVVTYSSKERNELLGPAFVVISSMLVYERFWGNLSTAQKIWTAAVFLIAVLVSILVSRKCEAKTFNKALPIIWITFLAVTQATVTFSETKMLNKLLSLGLPQSFFTSATLILTLVITYQHLTCTKVESKEDFASMRLNLFFAAGTFAAFINLASSGGTIYYIWFLGPFLYFTSYAIGRLRLRSNKNLIILLFSVISFGMASNLAFGVANPYTWWGWHEPSLLKPVGKSDLKILTGMRPAEEVNDFYTNIFTFTQTASQEVKSGSPRILTIGAIPMVSAVSGIDPYEGLYCKVQWFDLCPDAILLSDLDALKKSPPDIIVFQEIDDLAFKSHENGFLKSRSALREYKKFRNEQVRLGNWKEIGRVTTPGTNREEKSGFGAWDVIVYRQVE